MSTDDNLHDLDRDALAEKLLSERLDRARADLRRTFIARGDHPDIADARADAALDRVSFDRDGAPVVKFEGSGTLKGEHAIASLVSEVRTKGGTHVSLDELVARKRASGVYGSSI